MNIEQIEQIFEQYKNKLKELATYIHENPELGLEEKMACEAQVKLLKEEGFNVEESFDGYETAYKAVFKGEKAGARLCMLAEYDALPEIGHACGHNLIATVGVGSGLVIRDLVKELGGEITIIGTPAEETLGAKVKMANDGVFKDFDVVMMAHPMNSNADSINTMAIEAYYVRFKGRPAHAAAAPEAGVNALDAMINFYNLINAMRQQTKDDARIHGIITKGGTAPNVIPDFTEALFCVRAFKCDYLGELVEKFKKCAEGAAMGTGCELEIVQEGSGFKDTVSNLTLAEIHAQSKELVGQSNVLRMKGQSITGSSDIGNVSYECPAIQSTFDIADGKKGVPHTAEFADCAISDYGINMAFSEIKAFGETAYRLLTEPQLIKDIRAEFDKDVLGK